MCLVIVIITIRFTFLIRILFLLQVFRSLYHSDLESRINTIFNSRHLGSYFAYVTQMHSTRGSNGNAIKTKANVSFDNGFFFDIEAKRTHSIERKLV
jgi:hypothetical protein